MPKKNGISKTYSFDRSIIEMMEKLCKVENRSQTNLIEFLIKRYYDLLCKEKGE